MMGKHRKEGKARLVLGCALMTMGGLGMLAIMIYALTVKL
jgi:hypothetical protein